MASQEFIQKWLHLSSLMCASWASIYATWHHGSHIDSLTLSLLTRCQQNRYKKYQRHHFWITWSFLRGNAHAQLTVRWKESRGNDRPNGTVVWNTVVFTSICAQNRTNYTSLVWILRIYFWIFCLRAAEFKRGKAAYPLDGILECRERQRRMSLLPIGTDVF